MSITIDFSPADMELIERQASANSTTVEAFIREASAKAARNAEYLARLKQAEKNLKEGKGVYMTDKELEELVHGNAV